MLPLMARDLGAEPAMIGLVMAASTITGALLKLPAGAASDVLGRRPLLLAAAAVFALLPYTYLVVPSLVALVAVRFIHGSATAIMGPVMSATISDLAPVDRRATWLSTYATVQGAGQALAPVLAGWLITIERQESAFVIAGVAAMTSAWILQSASLPAAAVAASTRRASFFQGIGEVVRERRILVASVTHAAYFAINGTLNAFLPLFAQDRLRMSAAEIGATFGVQVVTTLAVRPLIGAASDRVGRRGAIVAGLAGCAISVAWIAMTASAPELLAAVVVYAISVSITTTATSAYITDVAPKARFGSAHGVFGTIYDIGDAAGPLLAGVLISSMGYSATFQLMAALGGISAIAFIAVSREPAA